MKIEMDDNSFWLGITLAIVAGIVAIVIPCTIVYQHTVREAFKAGYVQKQMYGQSSTVWSKQ